MKRIALLACTMIVLLTGCKKGEEWYTADIAPQVLIGR